MRRRGPVAIAAIALAVTLSGCSGAAQPDATASQSAAPVSEKTLLGTDPGTLSPSADAPVTLVEFADYQCPPCGMVSGTMTDIAEKYPDEVSVVIRNFPLTEIHPNAEAAAHAAEAARVQGRFPEMYKALFNGQQEWSELSGDKAEDVFADYAKTIGLDLERFDKDRNGSAIADLVKADQADGKAVGVQGTPTLFLNGEPLEISTLEDITSAVEGKIAQD